MIKTKLLDLALWGGPPLFEQALFVGRPNLLQPEATLQDISQIFTTHRLTNAGPVVTALEAEICELLDVPHCVVVANATLGLLLLLKALDLKGQVIVPSFTFPATVHVLPWLGLEPVFCDIDPHSHNLDPTEVKSLIGPQTAAILGVHLWGESCEIESLQSLAKQHQLPLIFDAAHALACSYQGKMIGNFGQAEVFSFHATKFVNSLEGGAITTHDPELAKKLRLWMNFGFNEKGLSILPGLNAKLNEVSAAVCRRSLQDIPRLIEINYARYQVYAEGLKQIPGIKLYHYNQDEQRNYQYIILEVQPEFGLSRNQLWQILQAEGVICRRYFSPGCHRLEPYQNNRLRLPETEKLSERVLALPNGTGIELKQVEQICKLIGFLHQNAQPLQSLWPSTAI